jgi:hypothetical protein
MMEAAELLGLLVGMSAHWVATGFAPPLVLHSLAENAPRILALGAALGRAAAERAELSLGDMDVRQPE